jgi:outer membrane protein TolC
MANRARKTSVMSRIKFPIHLILIPSLLLLIDVSCSSYHQMPLDRDVVASRLSAPSMDLIKVEARKIKHPILRPVEVDEQKGLTPEEAAILAILINPGLRAERDKKGISTAQLLQAGILPNPQFSGSLDFPVAGTTQGTVTAYGLSLGYDINALITRDAGIEAARLNASSVALNVAWQEWQVAEAAKLHAYRLYLLQKQLKVARDEEKGLQDNFKAIKRAVDLGYMTIIDLSAAQASLEKVHLVVLGIAQNMAQERFALLNAIGFGPERSLYLRQKIELPKEAAIPQSNELIDGIADRRLDLVALKIGYASQEERLRAAVLGQFPRITTDFSQARDTGNVVTRGLAITIGLPFFDRNQGQVAIERATRQQLFDEYIARLFEAQSKIVKLRADIESTYRQIRATEVYLPTQQQLVETYHNALLQGSADVLTYYNARDELIANHISLLNLQLQLIDQFVALEIAAGQFLEHPGNTEVSK